MDDERRGPFDAQVTFCYTRNLAETARFYEDGLGLPLALDQGACRIYRTSRAAYLGFCTRAEASRPDGIILTLVTENVDDEYARLRSRGLDIEEPPRRNAAFGIYHFFLRDPNGYLIEVQRFEDPRWQTSVE